MMTTTHTSMKAASAAIAAVILTGTATVHAAELRSCARCTVIDSSPGMPTPGAPGGGVGTSPGMPTPGAPQPNWDGPTSIPTPPATIPGPTWTPPSYESPYLPTLPPLIAPRPVIPVKPVVPPPDSIRVGNLVRPIPPGMALTDVRAINRTASYEEARIATVLVSLGIPRDEASRRAAATVLGAAGGATVGAAVAGVPAATLGASLGVVPGAIAGGIAGGIVAAPLALMVAPILPPGVAVPLGVVAGMGVGAVGGAAAGAAIFGVPVAIAGGAVGGVIGGILGYSLGAGDPGRAPGDRPSPGNDGRHDPWRPAPPNPKANQYELEWTPEVPGGPEATYTVTRTGDVRATLSAAGHTIVTDWSADTADRPYKALGLVAQTARDKVAREVIRIGDDAQRAIDGLRIDYPQYTGKHRKADR